MLSLCLAASSLIAGPSPQPRAGVARRAQPRMVLEVLQTIEALQTAGATARHAADEANHRTDANLEPSAPAILTSI